MVLSDYIIRQGSAKSCETGCRRLGMMRHFGVLIPSAVYLAAAAKSRRLTPRLSQEQKGLDERARTASQWPLPPVDVLEASRVDARRLLRPPFLAASHYHSMLTPPLAVATVARG